MSTVALRFKLRTHNCAQISRLSGSHKITPQRKHGQSLQRTSVSHNISETSISRIATCLPVTRTNFFHTTTETESSSSSGAASTPPISSTTQTTSSKKVKEELHPTPPHIFIYPASAGVPFKLSTGFVDKFKTVKPPFGFNGLGELVYRRSYSRVKPDGTNEEWYETVERVVNGTYTMQKRWIEQHQLGWNAWQGQKSAQEMYRRIFEMKFLPPGRGLWAMGSPITEQKGLYAALNNCAFVSTETIKDDPSKPFAFLMDLAMLGVGVGFDTKGAGNIIVKGPRADRNPEVFKIPDTREGWVESVRLLIDSYFHKTAPQEFDYSEIRPMGMPIKGFGGISSGPDPLKEVHIRIRSVLDKETGQPLSITSIVDIMNLLGRCVVSGNVRRTAEIAFGDPNSQEYIDLKNYDVNPQRAEWGWTSNNSVFASIGMDYGAICDRIVKNGEPGFAWLSNMQNYSRMNGIEDLKDHRARGGNPCLEQTLESYELCCLVETFPMRHESLEDFQRTLKFAYLYAKTVTLGPSHWPESNRVLLRNRRIGCSLSGIAQYIDSRGIEDLRKLCVAGYNTIQEYDKKYSDWLAIPRSIKTTCVKPSGTVSLLAGATPGMHFPISNYYIRRVRLPSDSPLLKPLLSAGYKVEPAVESPQTTVVVEFPITVGGKVRKAKDVSMWEQLSLAAFLQKYWADNQVSCTVTFDPEKEGAQLKHALDLFQYQLKGISFLPDLSGGAYKQMPYEEISEEQYNGLSSKLKTLDWAVIRNNTPMPEKFCDSNSCNL